jgi:GTPase SAR1 family protein
MITMEFGDRRAILLSVLDRAASIAVELGAAASRTAVQGEMRKLSEDRFHLVVIGQFKRGKTTFINSILGESLLPVAVVPLTSVVTLIKFGLQKRIEVVFEQAERMSIEPAQLPEYVTERGNPMNLKKVRYVEVTHPSDFLREGIVLIDTPGIGSLFLHNTETTYDFIPNIDAAIFVLSPDPPLTQMEYEFLGNVKKAVGQMFFILNKVDLLSPSETDEVLNYIRTAIEGKIGDSVSIFSVSARQALEARESGNEELLGRSGLQECIQGIARFLESKKGELLLQASERRAAAIVDGIGFHSDFRLRTLQTPLQELREKISEFDREACIIRREREEFTYLAQGRIKTLLSTIEEDILNLGRQVSRAMPDMIRGFLGSLGDTSDKLANEKVKQAAWNYMIEQFEAWRTKHEEGYKARYEGIVSEYSTKVNESITRIIRLSADMFDVKEIPSGGGVALEWEQTFTYKLGAQPILFDIDSFQVFGKFLPSKIYKMKQLERMTEEVSQNVMQNCGRLSYEYRYSMQESYKKFQYELDIKFDQLLDEIADMLEQSSKREEEGSLAVRNDIGRLNEVSREIRALKERLVDGCETSAGGAMEPSAIAER